MQTVGQSVSRAARPIGTNMARPLAFNFTSLIAVAGLTTTRLQCPAPYLPRWVGGVGVRSNPWH